MYETMRNNLQYYFRKLCIEMVTDCFVKCHELGKGRLNKMATRFTDDILNAFSSTESSNLG